MRYPLSCRYDATSFEGRPGFDESPTTAIVWASPSSARSSASGWTYASLRAASSRGIDGLRSRLRPGFDPFDQRPQNPRGGAPDHRAVHVVDEGVEPPAFVLEPLLRSLFDQFGQRE